MTAMMRGRTLMVVAAVLFAAGAATGQAPRFRASIDVVEVDVAVTRGGKPVAGLTADQFVLTDGGAPQTVRVRPLADLPLRIVLTLDTSDSVRGSRLRRLIEAGLGLTDELKVNDQIALVTFSHDARMVVPMGPPSAAIRRALGELAGGGSTALRDALQLALASEASQRSRSLVLLFSDGADTASWMPIETVFESARRSNSVVHVVRFDVNQADRPSPLDRVATVTGGRTWVATSDRELEELFTRALNDMRLRYVLTYTPGGTGGSGWHEIKVSLKDARGDVTARPGYWVP